MMDFIWRSLVIGAGGTAAMDIWVLLLKGIFGLALPNWGMVGRWFAHVPRGRMFSAECNVKPAWQKSILAMSLAVG